MTRTHFDATILGTLDRCEVLGVTAYRDDLAEPGLDASKHLGTALHAGIHTFYARGSAALAVECVRDTFGGFVSPRKPWITAQYASQIMQMFPQALDVTRLGYEVLHTEQYLANDGMEYCGIMDLHVRNANGEHGVFDVKSTALWLSRAWQEQWRHSEQGAGYLDLAEHTFGVPMHYFGVLAIHVQSAKLRKNGTWKALEPVADDFVMVGPHSYSPELRTELRVQRYQKILRAWELWRGNAAPLKRTSACHDFNRACYLLKYCTLAPRDRADAMALAQATGELATTHWDPATVRAPLTLPSSTLSLES